MKHLFIFILLGLIANSCKRDKSTWDVDIIGPAAQSEFRITDLIPDSLLSSNSENNLILTYHNEFLNLKADTLLSLNDTIIGDNFTVPPPFTSLQILPGFPFPASLSTVNLNPGNDIEIKEAIVCTGNISIQMINPLQTSLLVTYIVPGLTLNDDVLSIEQLLDPAIASEPSVTVLDIDVADYVLDLTGVDGLSENELAQSLSIINTIDGDTVVATLSDTLKFEIELNDLTFSYAKGYIGSFDIAQQNGVFLENNLGLQPGNILINEASIDLEIRNGVGVDFRITDSDFNTINSTSLLDLAIDNIALTENININRAVDSGDGPIYSNKFIHLDESNSNITDIIELAPDSFNILLNLEVNPLGNSSSSNDFIYKNDGVIINADIEIPLCLSINELKLTDSLQFSFDEELSGSFEQGVLTIYAENAFPFSINIDLSILHSDQNETDILIENNIIEACISDGTTCELNLTEINIPLNGNHLEQLRLGGELLINGEFNSNGEVKLSSQQSLKLQAVIDAKVNISL